MSSSSRISRSSCVLPDSSRRIFPKCTLLRFAPAAISLGTVVSSGSSSLANISTSTEGNEFFASSHQSRPVVTVAVRYVATIDLPLSGSPTNKVSFPTGTRLCQSHFTVLGGISLARIVRRSSPNPSTPLTIEQKRSTQLISRHDLFHPRASAKSLTSCCSIGISSHSAIILCFLPVSLDMLYLLFSDLFHINHYLC